MLNLQKIKLTEGKQKMHPVSFTGKRLATVFRAVAKNLSNDIETTQTDLENAILFRANGLVKACGESFQFDRIERTDADGHEAYTLTNADGEKLTAFVGTSEKAIFTTSRVTGEHKMTLRRDYTLGTKILKDLTFGAESTEKQTSALIYLSYGYNSWAPEEERALLECMKTLADITIQNNRYYKYYHSASVARAFETKKNINEETKRAMADSRLNAYFSGVEFDDDVDLTKVKQFERKALVFLQIFGIHKSKPVIRFRKLGKYSSAKKTVKGLYFPEINNIAVDFRDGKVDSFVHEYGHFADHELSDNISLSLEKDFKPILEDYRKRIKGIENEEYYTIPTEVFARAWQMYIGEQYNDKDINDYNSDEPQFAPLVEMKAEVMAYFEKVLG